MDKLRTYVGQYFWLSLIIILSVICIGWLQIPRLRDLTQNEEQKPEQIRQEVRANEAMLKVLEKFPTFGFDNLIADWVLLEFLEYFGDDEARAVTGYQLSPEYFEIIIGQDPRFIEAYFFLSSSVSLFAGQPERTVELMEKGLKSLSPRRQKRAYYIWRYKATDELLFLGDTEAAKNSYRKAAEWASIYEDEESKRVARISRQTAEFLERNPASKSAQINAWTMILENAVNEEIQENAIRKIEQLGGKVNINSQGEIEVQLPQQD